MNPLTYHKGQQLTETDALIFNFIYHFQGNRTDDERRKKKWR